RLVGYELRPGVAASTYLAFTLDKTAGTVCTISATVPDSSSDSSSAILTSSITITEGIKVQSIPGPDEQPQTYETIEEIEARPEWNEIKPRRLYPQTITGNNDYIIIRGTANDLKKGDVILIEVPNSKIIRKIVKVTPDNDKNTTRIDFIETSMAASFADDQLTPNGNIKGFSTKPDFDDSVVTSLVANIWKEEDLAALLEMKKWTINDVLKAVKKKLIEQETPADKNVYIFRKAVYPFGYNAPRQVKLTNGIPDSPLVWIDLTLHEEYNKIWLDNEYKEVLAESYVAVHKQPNLLANAKIFKITKADPGSRSEYGISGKTTLLNIDSTLYWYDNSVTTLAAIRDITLFVQNEKLELDYLTNEKTVQGDVIVLQRWYPGLKKGQKII